MKSFHSYSILFILLLLPLSANAKDSDPFLTIDEAIEKAIGASFELKAAKQQTMAAKANRAASATDFFPRISGGYEFTDYDEERLLQNFAEEASGYLTVMQPLFAGFAIKNGFVMAKLGLKSSELNEAFTMANLILETKEHYFSVLKSAKLRDVAKETVRQLDSHKHNAKNFYEVGMTPYNDLLKAEVQWANSKQAAVIAENNFEIAKTAFNTLLCLPEDTEVNLADIDYYVPFEYDLAFCLDMMEKNRIELKLSDIAIRMAETEIKLATVGFYPSINLSGNYYRIGEKWDIRDPENFESEQWNVKAMASWELWHWGKTVFKTKEKMHYLDKAIFEKKRLCDQIRVEVKSSFLRVREAEQNILTAKQAVEQAEENFRINEEQYNEQVATTTEVLDAQTLLSETKTNYYNALYDFAISKARLQKAMGAGDGR